MVVNFRVTLSIIVACNKHWIAAVWLLLKKTATKLLPEVSTTSVKVALSVDCISVEKTQ